MIGKLWFWKRTGYIIGGFRFTMDDIEHGILRGNSRTSWQIFGSSYFFSGDERARYSLQKDPRIHFALNCGTLSSPAIKVYTTFDVGGELKSATKSFFATGITVVQKEGSEVEVHLSRLFKWFYADFAEKKDGRYRLGQQVDPMLRWILDAFQWPERPIQSVELVRLAFMRLMIVRIMYKSYNWTTNDYQKAIIRRLLSCRRSRRRN